MHCCGWLAGLVLVHSRRFRWEKLLLSLYGQRRLWWRGHALDRGVSSRPRFGAWVGQRHVVVAPCRLRLCRHIAYLFYRPLFPALKLGEGLGDMRRVRAMATLALEEARHHLLATGQTHDRFTRLKAAYLFIAKQRGIEVLMVGLKINVEPRFHEYDPLRL